MPSPDLSFKDTDLGANLQGRPERCRVNQSKSISAPDPVSALQRP